MGGPRLPIRYGDRFDVQISQDVRDGKISQVIADRLGVSGVFVRNRAHFMGLSREVYENGLKARSAAKRGKPNCRRINVSKVGKAAIIEHGRKFKSDPEISRLAHKIRASKVPLSQHAIIALHERGLTLDDLHFATGRPLACIVDLIKKGANQCA